ncbi:MAG: LPXTG cell wall anchor domain-containing protein [Brevibacterium sp.]|uniref:LPXTG cell wall anchor domain-containing protein n=1 Tax=Brevibacterium sp. TaxID=1701 RepID=UPI003F939F5B
MQKKLVQSSLAMAAAAALGLGGAFVAGPAAADQPEVKVSSENAVQTAVYKNLSDKNGELAPELGRFGVDGDQLVVGVSKETEKVKAFSSSYDNVKVVVNPKYVEAEPQADTDLVGGAGYLVSVPSDSQMISGCSTGFAGWDAQGNQVVLTAGHCAVDSTNGAQNEILDMELPSSADAADGEGFKPAGVGSIGHWGFNQYGSDINDNGTVADEDKAIDFAVIKVADGFTTKAEVTDWTSAGENDLSASTVDVTNVGAAVPGDSIEKSGRTTGHTEGTVLDDPNAFDYQNIGGRAVHGFEVTSGEEPFSAPGDSGGAVYQGSTAVGVISGGPRDDSPEYGQWSWVADLENSLAKSGESFTLDGPSEEPEAPSAPTVEDQTIEPKGAITGKAAAGADVKVTWTGAAEGEATAKADDSGNFTLEGPEAEGDYDAKAVATVDGQTSEAASFTVTVKASDDSDAGAAADGDDSNAEADADGKDADASAAADGDDADSSAAADGKDDEADSDADGDKKPEAPKVGDQTVVEGGKITGKAALNAEVNLTWKPVGDAQAGSAQAQAAPAEGSVTVKTDADGNFSAEAPAEAGDYAYSATVTANGQTSDATNFMVTVEAEEAPAERKLTVEPKEIAASDFVKKDKGVQITAEGFEEGEKVTLKVTGAPEGIDDFSMEETANADGVVGFSIYGTSSSNPEAYLGKYDLEVTGANDTEDEEVLTGSFQVVADEDGNGGGNDDGNGDGGGSDLPRTGAELTGLAAGAGLLLVGGAAVVLTMRRKKNN